MTGAPGAPVAKVTPYQFWARRICKRYGRTGYRCGIDVMAGPEVMAGSPVPLPRAWKLEPVEVRAVFPGGPRPSIRSGALVDFLAQELKRAI